MTNTKIALYQRLDMGDETTKGKLEALIAKYENDPEILGAILGDGKRVANKMERLRRGRQRNAEEKEMANIAIDDTRGQIASGLS